MAELNQLNGMRIEETYVGPSVFPEEFHKKANKIIVECIYDQQLLLLRIPFNFYTPRHSLRRIYGDK